MLRSIDQASANDNAADNTQEIVLRDGVCLLTYAPSACHEDEQKLPS